MNRKKSHQSKLSPEDQSKLRAMRRRGPEEWMELLNALPETIRQFAARIIWWDWFATRTVAERWPHLDTYLKFTTEECPYAPLVEALETLGYPTRTALTRADDPRSK